jgi:hypothetical protein
LDHLNRRQLLGRGGILLVAAGAASAGFAAPIARALAPPSVPGFTAQRRQAYLDLIASLDGAAGTQIDASRAAWAADRFAEHYSTRLPDNQVLVDAILDKTARGKGRGWLRSLADGERSQRDLAAQAAALAALPFSPTIDDGDYPPVPVIV